MDIRVGCAELPSNRVTHIVVHIPELVIAEGFSSYLFPDNKCDKAPWNKAIGPLRFLLKPKQVGDNITTHLLQSLQSH